LQKEAPSRPFTVAFGWGGRLTGEWSSRRKPGPTYKVWSHRVPTKTGYLRRLSPHYSGKNAFSVSAAHIAAPPMTYWKFVLTVDTGRRQKTAQTMGSVVGMPAVVTALEDAVDKGAGTDRWVRGLAS
jgi:hypothetical protein